MPCLPPHRHYIDRCIKLVETIDNAKSAAENAQKEIVKLDLVGEKLNWILFPEK